MITTEYLVPLWTSAQVAEVLGVSRWHVDGLGRSGELASVLVGSSGSRRYHPDDVADFIRRKRDGQ